MRFNEITKQKDNIYNEFDSIVNNNYSYNGHIIIKPFRIYMRLTTRFIDGDRKRTVDIGQIISSTPTRRTGKFKNVLDHIEKSAKINGFDGVYVESIMNTWLPDKLKEYGYTSVNSETDINMYKAV